MVSSYWLVAIGLATTHAFLAAADGQVASSTPPSSGFLNSSDTGLNTPAPKKTAVDLTPEMRGDIFMAEKRYREAAEMYADHSKGSAVMLNKTGIAYHQMLQLNSAEKYYRQALRVDPKYSEAVNNLGTIYYAKKSYRRAIGQYKKALRMTPDSASVWSNLAMGYFSRNDVERAQEALRKALMLDPDVFEHRSTQGVLLQERSVGERRQVSLLPGAHLRFGRQERSSLAIYPQGARRGLQGTQEDRGRSGLRADERASRIQGIDGERAACFVGAPKPSSSAQFFSNRS